MKFNIRPVRVTIVLSERSEMADFCELVLEMKVLRHEEHKLDSNNRAPCPDPLENRLCKTLFGYGPIANNFSIQVIHFYKNLPVSQGNDLVGFHIHSLNAVARMKALSIPAEHVDERTFKVNSPFGPCFWLTDQRYLHRDPIYAIVLRSVDLVETLHYWHNLLGVELISEDDDEFTLFFCNHVPNIKFVSYDVPVERSPCHLSFTLPLTQLKSMSDYMVKMNTRVEQSYTTVNYEGRHSDYLVILKDPNDLTLYFHDAESFFRVCKLDPNAKTRLDLSLSKANRQRKQ